MVSAVSIYEIELKAKRGRVDLPPQELRAALRRNAVRDLAVTHEHAEYAACLDWDHRDPWDRLLAAQARLESCALVSTDEVSTVSASTGTGRERPGFPAPALVPT